MRITLERSSMTLKNPRIQHVTGEKQEREKAKEKEAGTLVCRKGRAKIGQNGKSEISTHAREEKTLKLKEKPCNTCGVF